MGWCGHGYLVLVPVAVAVWAGLGQVALPIAIIISNCPKWVTSVTSGTNNTVHSRRTVRSAAPRSNIDDAITSYGVQAFLVITMYGVPSTALVRWTLSLAWCGLWRRGARPLPVAAGAFPSARALINLY